MHPLDDGYEELSNFELEMLIEAVADMATAVRLPLSIFLYYGPRKWPQPTAEDGARFLFELVRWQRLERKLRRIQELRQLCDRAAALVELRRFEREEWQPTLPEPRPELASRRPGRPARGK